MQKQVKINIHGRVQGVYFRRHTQAEARVLGLTGWACNTPEGTVEVLAEGEEDKLNELIAWCKDGPEHAMVKEVNTKWAPPTGKFDDFVVR